MMIRPLRRKVMEALPHSSTISSLATIRTRRPSMSASITGSAGCGSAGSAARCPVGARNRASNSPDSVCVAPSTGSSATFAFITSVLCDFAALEDHVTAGFHIDLAATVERNVFALDGDGAVLLHGNAGRPRLDHNLLT